MSILFVIGVTWIIIRIIAAMWASYNGNKAPTQWLTYEQSIQKEGASPKPRTSTPVYTPHIYEPPPSPPPVQRNIHTDTLELPVVEPDLWANTVPESKKPTTEIPITYY